MRASFYIGLLFESGKRAVPAPDGRGNRSAKATRLPNGILRYVKAGHVRGAFHRDTAEEVIRCDDVTSQNGDHGSSVSDRRFAEDSASLQACLTTYLANLIFLAALRDMRSKSHPWLQREMFVSPYLRARYLMGISRILRFSLAAPNRRSKSPKGSSSPR